MLSGETYSLFSITTQVVLSKQLSQVRSRMNRYNQTGADNLVFAHYNISNVTELEIQVCYMKNFTIGNYSLWQINHPMTLHLPMLAMQLSFMILVTQILVFILQPLHQPHFVAEVIAGILSGPTLFRHFEISDAIFNFDVTLVVETFVSLGLSYYMFLVGLEMDLSALRNIEKKSLSIAIGGIFISLVVGACLYFVPVRDVDGDSLPIGSVFWAIILSDTSFPDLARILANVKLLRTDLGRVALTSALISDIVTWILLVMIITFYDLRRFYMAVVPTTIFLLTCWFLLRPGIKWIIRQNEKKGKNNFSETHIHLIIVGVAICGCIADACGSHALMGGFMLGLIIPHGEFANDIMEKVQEFVDKIMLPIFFVLNGNRLDFRNLVLRTRWRNLALVTISATSTKIVSTLVICLFFGISSKEALALGVLLNTKGVLAFIVLNEGRDVKAMDNIVMLVMGFIVLFMTFLVAPIFFLVMKTTRRLIKYKRRSIQKSNPDTELRILTCVHSARNISGIINLLQISHANRKSPICVLLVHLVELTRRASAMLIVHDTSKSTVSTANSNNNNMTRERAESEQIVNAFRKYESKNDAVTLHALTAVSPYSTMHKDIFNLAEVKHITIILVPYHKLPTIDGRLHGDNLSIREVNRNLLVNAPCSIGILVDRGLGSSIRSDLTMYDKSRFRLAMLFIGGSDDHEALSYAMRMTRTSGVTLNVVRFLPAKDEELDIHVDNENSENEVSAAIIESGGTKEFDDEFINEFRFKIMCNQSITYQEKLVKSGNEIVEFLGSMYNDFDLYIVGRGNGVKSKLVMGLSEWNDCPELGPIGETLVTTHATEHASVLVVQQSTSCEAKFGQKKWTSPILNPDYKAFVHGKRIK